MPTRMNSLSVFRCRIVAVEGDDHLPQRRRRCDVVILDHGTDMAFQFVDIDIKHVVSLFSGFAFDAASISFTQGGATSFMISFHRLGLL